MCASFIAESAEIMSTIPLSLSDQLGLAFLALKNEGMRKVLEEVVVRQFRSLALHERARVSLSGTHSMLAYEALLLLLAVTRAVGFRIWDVDGNEYIDCHMSYSSTILGHNPPPVLAVVAKALLWGMQGGHFFEEQI